MYWAILLNYRHWADTAACADSLFVGSLPPERLIICDNGSEDGSLAALERWAQERTEPVLSLMRSQAESLPDISEFPQRTILIDNQANLGYAGGNNVGLRLFLKGDARYAWVLNNDTLVAVGAGEALLQHMDARPPAGLCGALTRYMESPDVVQCYGGGSYNMLFGLGHLHGDGDRLPQGSSPNWTRPLGYINGASTFVRREFLETVGFMEEAYFLYCEEIDWALRAKGRWELTWCPQAEVFHKDGLSTGVSNQRGRRRSLRQIYALTRSRLLLAMKFTPWALPTVLAAQAARTLIKAFLP
jgi:GT2 family glycosyltransferase